MGERIGLLTLSVLLFASILVLISVTRESGMKEIPLEATILVANSVYPKPELSAHAYLVKFLEEKEILIKRREWKPLAPASLSKLLTAVIAKEYLPPDELINFSPSAKKSKEDGEKLSAVKAGEALTKEDTLKLLLISSANDAGEALRERLGGEELFKEFAKEKSRSIGLIDSNFLNPTGLDQAGHKSSAEDLARLAEYIWRRHPDLWKITRTIETNIYTESGEKKLENTNKLLREFPAILGGKTGFTDNAKESLILLYPVRPDKPPHQGATDISRCMGGAILWCGGKVAVIVILGSGDRFEDGRKIINWLENGIGN